MEKRSNAVTFKGNPVTLVGPQRKAGDKAPDFACLSGLDLVTLGQTPATGNLGGGNGTLPSNDYGAPPPIVAGTPGDNGNNTYDAPAGVIVGGTVSAPVSYPNYSEASYFNETFTKISYNTAVDPNSSVLREACKSGPEVTQIDFGLP